MKLLDKSSILNSFKFSIPSIYTYYNLFLIENQYKK
jgi:hypothetical protein